MSERVCMHSLIGILSARSHFFACLQAACPDSSTHAHICVGEYMKFYAYDFAFIRVAICIHTHVSVCLDNYVPINKCGMLLLFHILNSNFSCCCQTRR